MTGCDEEELAGGARVGDKEAFGPADGWARLCGDWETDGSGEGLDDADSGRHQCIGKVVETSPEWFRTIVLTEQLPRTLFCLFGSPSSNHSSGMTTKESSSGNVITRFPDVGKEAGTGLYNWAQWMLKLATARSFVVIGPTKSLTRMRRVSISFLAYVLYCRYIV